MIDDGWGPVQANINWHFIAKKREDFEATIFHEPLPGQFTKEEVENLMRYGRADMAGQERPTRRHAKAS